MTGQTGRLQASRTDADQGWDLLALCGLGERRARLLFFATVLGAAAAYAATWSYSSAIASNVSTRATLTVLVIAAITCPLVSHIIDARVRSGKGESIVFDMTGAVSLSAMLLLPPRMTLAVVACLEVVTWLRLSDAAVKLAFNVAIDTLGISLASFAVRPLISYDRLPLQQVEGYLLAVSVGSLIFCAVTTGLVVSLLTLAFSEFSVSLAVQSLPAEVTRTATAGAAVALFAAKPVAILLYVPVVVVAVGEIRGRESGQRARLDPKTNLSNGSSLMATLERELSRAKRRGVPVAVAMIDLDRFRDLNQRYGHVRADTALIKLAGILDSAARRGHSTGRWGGDELAWVMPDTELASAVEAAETFRCNVEQQDFFGDDSTTVTVSVGVAVWDGLATAVELLATADQALYAAKENGRNAVKVAAKEPSREL